MDTVHSRALAGNLIGDATDRPVYIYLPPSYGSAHARRFPVLYLLHGMTSHPSEWLDGSYQEMDLARMMDSLVAQGGTEFLVVMPEADNAYGGTFYRNSPAFGGWDRFVSDELVQFVDLRYRTWRDRNARGLAGQSMGGFGALAVASSHPNTFGSVFALSACCLGLVGELDPTSPVWAAAAAPDSLVPRAMRGRVRIVRAMAAAFAPRERLTETGKARTPLAGPLPFRADGTTDSTTLAIWRRWLPLDQIPSRDLGFRRMGEIALDFGLADEIPSVPLGTLAFAAALERARAPVHVVLTQHDGGHVDRTRERFAQVLLPYFSRIFAGTVPAAVPR